MSFSQRKVDVSSHFHLIIVYPSVSASFNASAFERIYMLSRFEYLWLGKFVNEWAKPIIRFAHSTFVLR